MKTSFPKDKISVVLLEGIHADGREILEREGFQIRAEAGALEGDELAEALADAHVVGIRSKTTVAPEALEAAPRLLAVGCFCAGTNQVALPDAATRGVPVFNAPFSNTRSVAELTVCEVVALHRRLAERSAQMHEGVWDKSASGAHEVRGRTLGIIGYGHIGTQVSVLAEAMGMRVIYHDIVPKLPLGNARPVGSLAELLSEADVVTLHVPATPRTRGMIGAEELRLMRPDAYLINNARGSVVDTGALAVALRERRIAGAALDVFPEEPAAKGLPFDSELRGLPNVVLTPHIGGSTVEAQATIAREVAHKLVAFVNNGSTIGAVNVPQVDLLEQGRAAAPAEDGGAELRPHRILYFHRNVPGVLSKMHAMISDLGVNVVSEHLQTLGEVGYVVLDVDPANGNALLDGLRSIPETIKARILW